MSKHEVVIDGKIYVPAIEASPTVDTIMQTLWESYMGRGERWNEKGNAGELWVGLNEDGEGESLEEFAARIVKNWQASD